MLRQVLRVYFASYRRQLSRVLLVISAMIFACAGLGAVLIINDSAKASYAQANTPLLNNVTHQIEARPGERIDKSDYAALRRAGFSQVVAVTEKTVAVDTDNDSAFLTLIGIDTFALIGNNQQLEQNNQGLDLAFASDAQVFISDDLASSLPLSSDNSLELKDGSRLTGIKVQTELNSGQLGVTDIGYLQSRFNSDDISYLLVMAKEQGEVFQQLKSHLPEHLILNRRLTGQDAAQLTDSFHLNLLAMGLLMFVVCMFVVMNALQLLFSSRIGHLRILRQLGVHKSTLYWALLVELFILSLLCTPFGLALGTLLAYLASGSVIATLQNLYNIDVVFQHSAWIGLILPCFLACLSGAFISALLPFKQIEQKMALVNSVLVSTAKSSLWDSNVKAGVAGLVAASLLLLLNSDSVWLAFAQIGLTILLGCALILVLVPRLLAWLGQQPSARYMLLRWSIADAIRISRQSKIAFCAFFIAVASNIGMNIMVDSFRSATESWLTQRLVADAYISSEQGDQFQRWLAQSFPTAKLYPRYAGEGRIDGNEVQLRSYPDDSTHRAAMVFDRQAPAAWQDFQQGKTVLINQQLGFQQNLQIGDRLALESPIFGTLELDIGGIYFDYGNTQPQILLPNSQWQMRGAQAQQFGLFVNQQDELARIKSALPATLISTNMLVTKDLLDISMDTFDNTFLITDGLNIVTLLVAGFSLATSILIIDLDNRPQRGLLRSLGVSSRKLLSLSLLQYLGLSLLICCIALPFGLLLSWLLVNNINVIAFHWSYPLQINLTILFKVVLISLAIVTIVVLLPLLKQHGSKPIEDIKCL